MHQVTCNSVISEPKLKSKIALGEELGEYNRIQSSVWSRDAWVSLSVSTDCLWYNEQ